MSAPERFYRNRLLMGMVFQSRLQKLEKFGKTLRKTDGWHGRRQPVSWQVRAFDGSMIRKFWNTLKCFYTDLRTYNKSKNWLRPWNARINFRRLRPNSESSLAIRLCATLNIQAVKICPTLCGVGYQHFFSGGSRGVCYLRLFAFFAANKMEENETFATTTR